MGFAIAGAAAIGGALISSSASQNAANTEAGAANAANGLTTNMFNTEEANAKPWLTAGQNALGELQTDLPSLDAPFTMQDFQESPGYQFQLNQGLQAMQRSAAAKGMLNSSGTQQNLNNYAQGAANTDYQQALQNYLSQNQQKYNMLSGISNQGLSAASLTNSAAQNTTNNISANTIGAGNASAAGQIGTANAINGGLSSVANGYMNYNMMSNLFGNQNPYANMSGGSNGMMMPQLGSTAAPAQPNYSLGANLTD